ncbi:MAG: hypothetical protein RJA70_2290 [Pseudomonadota bacterium]|jgi:tetratricopeptide (TPR) repeat protein
MSLPSLKNSKLQALSVVLCGAVLAGLGFLPLFAGPSYEFALACGIVVALIAAPANAIDVALHQPSPAAAFQRGLTSGVLFALLSLSIAVAHGVRAGFCDAWAQLPLFFLGPLVGALCSGTWGAMAGLILSPLDGRRRRVVLALGVGLLGPLLSIAVSFGRYYASPMIFAFDHFVGFFAGTLYDTEIDGADRLLTYRVGSAGWLLLAFGFCAALDRSGRGFSLEVRTRLVPLTLAIVGLAAGTAIAARGPQLGHYQTAETIRSTLGHVAKSRRCEVVYAVGIAKRDADALARECDEHVEQQERFFELRFEGKITVFLFASSAQKAQLMGARDVYIAKPWRREIYIQQGGYPHPVLGHELAHVVAGAFAQGPFLVAGPLGGWIPDPGRIEGFAVAASPSENDDLTLQQWSRAMKDLQLLPPLSSVFKLSFLGQNSSTAYTVAGSFVQWLHRTHGAAAVKRWYGGEPVWTVTGKPLSQLESEYHAFLDQVEVSAAAMNVAKTRFSQPAIFGRACPHEVDQLTRLAGYHLNAQDPRKAEELYREVLALDLDNYSARLGLGDCSLKERDLAAASQRFEQVARDVRLKGLWEAWAKERVGNTAWVAGDIAAARKLYRETAESVVDEDHLRSLDIKLLVTPDMAPTAPVRSAVHALLIGDPTFGTDWTVAGAELGRWSELDPKDGTADYLLGRNYFSRGRWEEAAARLDQALSKPLRLPRVLSESLRTRLFVACALGQTTAASQAYARYGALSDLPEARRLSVQRLAERCGAAASSNSSGPEPTTPGSNLP